MSELEFVPRFDPRSAPGKSSNPTGTLPEGTRLGEFELIRVIGDGGFGIVYLAWDHSLERRVALKEYMPATLASRVDGTTVHPRSERVRDTFEAGLRSFINEARLLASFDHPALIKVYRFWEANGTACMVMPFYEAGTLQAAVKALPTPPDEVWLRRLLTPLCDALAMLHAAHCYHRDISPDNILLLPPADRPLLLDFGAARRVIGGMTHSLTTILKPGYAPIEQYAEVPGLRQGPATDVYALAATVHWMITGNTPPPAVARVLEDAYEPLEVTAAGRYSPVFLKAIDRALAVRPEARTPTIEAFREDINAKPQARVKTTRKVDAESTVVLPLKPPVAATAAVTASALPNRRRAWFAVAAAAVVTGVVSTTLVWRQRAPELPVAAAPREAPVSPPVATVEKPAPTVTPAPQAESPSVALVPAPGAASAVATPPPADAKPPVTVKQQTPVAAKPAPRPSTAAVTGAATPPREPKERSRAAPSVPTAPKRTAEQAAAEVRRVECTRLTQRGLFSQPSEAQRERARRLGCP